MSVMLLVVFPIIGITISNAYKNHMLGSIESRLKAYSYSILSVAEVDQGEVFMPDQLLEDQFNISQSGLYASITQTQLSPKEIWTSESLIALTVPNEMQFPALGQSLFYTVTLDREKHFVYSFSVSFEASQASIPFTVNIISNQKEFNNNIQAFEKQLMVAMLFLMFVVLAFQIIWLLLTLRPLSLLKTEIIAIEKGESDRFDKQYPLELKQVTKQLNALLQSEQAQRTRFRNALSDLAHSLKTPLAVIQSQSDISETTKSQLAVVNNTIEHQLKKAQSAGQAAWHVGICVLEVSSKLVSSLEKIHHDKALDINIDCPQKATFKGDETDLMEILGNLLDNACKAASSQVTMLVDYKDSRLTIAIEDDGPGIDEEMAETIFSRGVRADTYDSGHGIGLAIVRDLCDSYHGKLTLTRSHSLGGACFKVIFNDR